MDIGEFILGLKLENDFLLNNPIYRVIYVCELNG